MDYSTNIIGVREIAEAKNQSEEHAIFSSLQSLRLFFGIISCFLSVVYVFFTVKGHLSFVVTAFNIVVALWGYYLTATWYHQGKQDMTILAVTSLIARVIQLSVMFLFIKTYDDITLAVFANSLVFFIPGAITSLYRNKRHKIKYNLSYKKIGQELRKGFNAFVGDFAPNLYSNLPPLLIGLFTTPAVFASYSLSLRIVNIAGSFQLMLAKAIYPSVVKGEVSLKAMMVVNVIIALFPILVIYLYGKQIIALFLGGGYEEVSYYLIFLAPTILFASILYALTYGYFLPNKLDKEFRNISLIVSVISAVIGYFLIYKIGVLGAIAMFVLARFLFMTLFVFYYFKLSKKLI